MANYKAVANGNWSALATWEDDSTGSYVASTVLPGASDVVYLNNRTVVMDVDVTVLEIRNDIATGVTGGGGGVISTSRTVNADLYHRTGTLITISATSPNVVNITGNMPGTFGLSNSTGINCTGNATLNYVGNITATLINNSTNVAGIRLATSQILNLTGDVLGGQVIPNYGFTNNANGIVSAVNCTINIVGNVTGATNGVNNTGIIGANGAAINVTGQVIGGVGTTLTLFNRGILLSNNEVITIIGTVSSGLNSFGIYGITSDSKVRLYGNAINGTDGLIAVACAFCFIESTNMSWQFRKLDLTTNTLYTPGVATGHPAEANVRTGVTYGPTNNLTGTCAVPPANTVSLGVPVDNTVGTAQLDTNALAASLTATLAPALDASLSVSLDASLSASLPAAIAPLLWDEDVANLTTPNSIGERVKNCATVATTGAQIASFNP